MNTGDGTNLEFIGLTGSSQELNNNYFGYHVITKISEYDFLTEIDYGNVPIIGNDIGYARHIKNDPFIDYYPIDIIDVGVNSDIKQSIELSIDNVKLIDNKYSLINLDLNKYRFRLIDGLDIDTINNKYSWILEAEITDAIIGTDGTNLIWYNGIVS